MNVPYDPLSAWLAPEIPAAGTPGRPRRSWCRWGQARVLAQAVADGRLDVNPADYVKLPTDHNTGHVRAVDDPAMFLSAAQVAALVAATPWPYNLYVHLAAWSGLRAAELAGLRVSDLKLPPPSMNPNAPAKPGTVRVDRTIAWAGATATAIPPKTKGSRRTVPLTPATTALLREYLAVHPRRDDPTAPLFPNVHLHPPRPTGVAYPLTPNQWFRGDETLNQGLPGIEPGSRATARRQANALAYLSTVEAGERLVPMPRS